MTLLKQENSGLSSNIEVKMKYNRFIDLGGQPQHFMLCRQPSHLQCSTRLNLNNSTKT